MGAVTERLTEFTNGPLTFDVLDDGPLDGTPVVLLHGFPQRASSWELVAPLLHEQGYRTLAPDQRGYSPRARPSGRRAYALDHLTADVIALIDALGVDEVHLVGHDWGAAAAWSVAGHHPDRISSLTAVSVPHPGAFMQAMPRGQLLRSWYMAFFNLPVIPEKALTALFATSSGGRRMGLPEPYASRLNAEIIESGALTGALNWYRGLPFAATKQRRTRVPTTYVWSDGDFALGRRGAQLTAGWVDAPYEFQVIEGANHWLPETHPRELAEAILARMGSVGADA